MKKLLILLICLPALGFAQHELKATFSPAEDFTYAFLYKMTPADPIFIANAKLDSLGTASIALDSTATPGIYKVIYALPPEENNFDFIYNGKENVELSFDLQNGVEFLTSNENKLWASYLKSMDIINRTISNYYSKESTDEKAFMDIFKTLKETQTAYENSSENTLVNTFIKANKPYIPSEYQSIKTYSQNLKSNYFTSINFDDPLLQSSTFISDRVNGFVFNLVETPEDSTYKEHIDLVATAIKPYSDKTQSDIFVMLWERFVTMGKDHIANYIADTYLLAISSKMNDTDLTQRLSTFKNTALGVVAPDFKISAQNEETKMLSDLDDSENYILVFWSSNCGHCLEELPQLKTLLKNYPTYKVIAFGIEDSASRWSNEIKNYPDFIHTLGLQKWNNPIVNTYGISATPTYFVLDKGKKIMAKPYDMVALKTYLSKK
ncbi:TlpA family protein disulfide reductase [Winogradskyella sp. A3E31]|uniref:TlpA family protein disulfide reductase n=1 Tax=Winogradskyella sp. A3E31 TaxID=3349637 RepID=UPI00398B666F